MWSVGKVTYCSAKMYHLRFAVFVLFVYLFVFVCCCCCCFVVVFVCFVFANQYFFACLLDITQKLEWIQISFVQLIYIIFHYAATKLVNTVICSFLQTVHIALNATWTLHHFIHFLWYCIYR